VPKTSPWADLAAISPKPAVGQVWESCDVRELVRFGARRRIRIVEIVAPTTPGGRTKARCSIVFAGRHHKRNTLGKVVEILAARLFPSATGYRYIEGGS
jgi:hypothetical protein